MSKNKSAPVSFDGQSQGANDNGASSAKEMIANGAEKVKANPVCTKIGKINFTDNVVPKNWFRTILLPSKKADLLAINILSEVVYWYRPSLICDEATGQVIGNRQKFRADKLQRSYQSFADLFGVSKRQIKMAIDRLVSTELVKTEFRTVLVGDTMLNNVLFLEPIPENIAKITHPQHTDIISHYTPSYKKMQEGVQKNVRQIQRL